MHLGLSENSVPLHPMVNDEISLLNGYNWGYTLFSDKPISKFQTWLNWHMVTLPAVQPTPPDVAVSGPWIRRDAGPPKYMLVAKPRVWPSGFGCMLLLQARLPHWKERAIPKCPSKPLNQRIWLSDQTYQTAVLGPLCLAQV